MKHRRPRTAVWHKYQRGRHARRTSDNLCRSPIGIAAPRPNNVGIGRRHEPRPPIHAYSPASDRKPLMSTTPSTHDNPLLDFSDLPRFGDIRPEHVTPALDVLLANATAAVERAAEPSTPASWADVVEPGRARHRAALARMGRDRPPERRGRHAGTARRLRRESAARDRILVERRTKPRALRKVQGARRQQRLRARSRANARKSSAMRCAISACRARNCRKTRSRTSPNCRNARRTFRRRFPTTCWTRPTPTPTSSKTRQNWPACRKT